MPCCPVRLKKFRLTIKCDFRIDQKNMKWIENFFEFWDPKFSMNFKGTLFDQTTNARKMTALVLVIENRKHAW